MVEINPTNTKTSIAYRTRRYFYEQMREHMIDAEMVPAPEKTFFRILKRFFGDIRFVKVRSVTVLWVYSMDAKYKQNIVGKMSMRHPYLIFYAVAVPPPPYKNLGYAALLVMTFSHRKTLCLIYVFCTWIAEVFIYDAFWVMYILRECRFRFWYSSGCKLLTVQSN